MNPKFLIAGMILAIPSVACIAEDNNRPPTGSPAPSATVSGLDASAITVGEWTPEQLAKPGAVLEWDITREVTGPGECRVSFHHTSGAHGLDISSVALLEDGTEIARDTHPGFSGTDKIDRVYTLRLPALKQGAKSYTLQAAVAGRGGSDSFGDVWWSTQPAEPPP